MATLDRYSVYLAGASIDRYRSQPGMPYQNTYEVLNEQKYSTKATQVEAQRK